MALPIVLLEWASGNGGRKFLPISVDNLIGGDLSSLRESNMCLSYCISPYPSGPHKNAKSKGLFTLWLSKLRGRGIEWPNFGESVRKWAINREVGSLNAKTLHCNGGN